MASYRGDRVNPGDALDCSLYGDLRIAEEEPEEEPEEEFSSNHNLFLSPCFLLVVPLISLYLRRNPGRRIDRINSHVLHCTTTLFIKPVTNIAMYAKNLKKRKSNKLKILFCLKVFISAAAMMVVSTKVAQLSTGNNDSTALLDMFTGSAPASLMQKLSSANDFYPTLEVLYHKYGAEIAAYRPIMRNWCQKTNSCKYTDYEVEMLYMMIRERKPSHVFEMAPNKGYSSHWILHALHNNDKTSKLQSFDIHDTSVQLMDEKYKSRWEFSLGDYAKLYDDGKLDMEQFDFIFVDALHEEEFARGYCERLFSHLQRKNVAVAIHDIVADPDGGGKSSEVYKYLAFANNARNVFTMSQFAMPNSLYEKKAKEIVPKLNKMRAGLGIVKQCTKGDNCDDVLHDYLYFKQNDAPTIFFELNSQGRSTVSQF